VVGVVRVIDFKKYISERDILAMLVAAIIAHMIFGRSDISLSYDFHNGALPYGIVWNLINPLYWTQLPYKIIVDAIQFPVIALQLWLVKKGKLNKWMVYLNIATTVWYRLMINYQDVSNIEFMPFATMTPLVALSFLIQRYPFWTLIPKWSDPHFQCVIGNCVRFSVDRWAQTLQPSFASHITLALWFVLPLIAWYKKKQSQKWVWETYGIKGNEGTMYWRRYKKPFDETRFWKISTILMVAVMIEGIVTFVLMGCCFGSVDFPQT
jgi:hypothetical protein